MPSDSHIPLQAAADLLDVTPRHVVTLIEAGELAGVDVATHGAERGTVTGTDGKNYPARKRRLRVSVESLRAFLTRRHVGEQKRVPRRQRPEIRRRFL